MTAGVGKPSTVSGRIIGVHALMMLATILIGTSFPVGHEIAHGMEPGVLMMVRFAMGVVLMAPYVIWRYGAVLVPNAREFVSYAAIGGTMVGYTWAMFEGLLHTSALNQGALITTVPGLSAIFGAILLREQLGLHRIVALAIATVGALWIVFRGDPDRALSLDFNIGDAIFFGGCVSLALYTPFIRMWGGSKPPVVVTFWIIVTAFLWFVAISNAKMLSTDWGAVELKVYGGAAYLAIFTTIITFFIFQYGTPRIGATRAIAYNYFYPAVVLVLVWAMGQEEVSVMVIPGAIIVLAASVVVQRGAVWDRLRREPSGDSSTG